MGGATRNHPARRGSATVRATSAPNDQPATTRGRPGTALARWSSPASMSRRSSTPAPWSPSESPTPRKLKRRTARPWPGSVRNSSLVTSERIEPPWSGWGWASTTAATAASGTTTSASRATPSLVTRRSGVGTSVSSAMGGDGTVGSVPADDRPVDPTAEPASEAARATPVRPRPRRPRPAKPGRRTGRKAGPRRPGRRARPPRAASRATRSPTGWRRARTSCPSR